MERLPPSAIATMAPGYFAMVMATGIIAIGADQQGIGWLASALYVVAVIAYGVLGGLLGVRIVRYRQAFVTDLTDHMRGFSFLTVVAGTNVLAAASAVVHGWWNAAWVLWWIGNALWVVLVYSTLIAVVVSDHKPALGAGINGSWFLLTVATQSVAVVAALLLARADRDLLAFAAIGAFTLGIVLYVIVMTMVFLRWTFHALEPSEADPPAWIAAGAVAISVLAGSNLLLARDTSPRIARIAPFLEGMVIMVWATATFWFPLMIAIGVWRHLVRRIPLRYHPSYWALVPPRHVCRGDVPDGHRDRDRLPGLAPETRARRRPRRLERHVHRPPPPGVSSHRPPTPMSRPAMAPDLVRRPRLMSRAAIVASPFHELVRYLSSNS